MKKLLSVLLVLILVIFTVSCMYAADEDVVLTITPSVTTLERSTEPQHIIYTVTISPKAGIDVGSFEFTFDVPENMTLAENPTTQNGSGYWANMDLFYNPMLGLNDGIFETFSYTPNSKIFIASGATDTRKLNQEMVVMTIEATIPAGVTGTFDLGLDSNKPFVAGGISGNESYTNLRVDTTPVVVNKTDISSGTFEVADAGAYTGEELEPAVSALTVNGEAVDASNYDVSYFDNINAGKGTVTLTAKQDSESFTGSVSKEFDIAKAKLVKPSISGEFVFDGEEKSAVITGFDPITMSQEGTINATNAGEYTVTIGLINNDNYEWADESIYDIEGTWNIEKADITPEVTIENWEYSETANEPVLTGNLGEATPVYEYKLTSEADDAYTTAIPASVGAYTIRVTVPETSNYKAGTDTAEFEITKLEIGARVIDIASKVFDDSLEVSMDNVTIEIINAQLVKGTDYDVTAVLADKYVGTDKDVTVTVELKGEALENYMFYGDESSIELNSIMDVTAVESTLVGNPTTVVDADNTPLSLIKGKSLDVASNVTLTPDVYSGELVFSLSGDYTGVSIDGTILQAEATTEETLVEIVVTFNGKDLNLDQNNEYKSNEISIFVKITDKEVLTIDGLTFDSKDYDGTPVEPTGTLTVTPDKVATEDLEVKYEKENDAGWEVIDGLSGEVGKYRVTYSVSETNTDYVGSKVYEFEIRKVKLAKPTLKGTYTYNGEEQTAELNDFVEGKMIATNNARTNAGSQDITVALVDKVNYAWADESIDDVTIVFEIAKLKLTKPTLNGTYAYNGEEQTAELNDFVEEKMIATNNVRANAGSQDITVALIDSENHSWEDESIEDITIPFSIEKVTPTIAIDNLSQKVGSVTDVTYTVTPDVTDGSKKIEYKLSVSGDEAYSEVLPTEVGTYTVRVTVSEDSNLNNLEKVATLTITKVSTGGGGGSTTPKYQITVKQSANGIISPSTKKVEKGSDQKFEIKANKGYEIEDVLVDGKSVGAVSAYTFENVKEKHTIEAKFKKAEEVAEGWKNPFTDVKENDWFFDSVKYANENNLFKGVSESEFGPSINMTRGMIVTVLYRLEGEPATNKSIPFADVDMSMYYANPIIWAKQNNIVNGVDENNFAPNAQVTREQLVAILYRYAQYKGKDVSVGENTNILSYDDFSEISEYAIPAIQWGCGAGIISGRTVSTLAPKATATRAEVATMIMRFVK